MRLAAARVSLPRADGLVRPRLEESLQRIWSARAALVIGPAGSGKTTLLAHAAAHEHAPVAWYRAEPDGSSVTDVVADLGVALAAAGVVPRQAHWHSHRDAIGDLERSRSDRALLVVDDVHLLDLHVARNVFEPLIDDAPPMLKVLLASRVVPSINLAKLRLADQLVQVDANDLRFRSWETERLFRDVYNEPLPPQDLAELTRRTEGWAAGLQLFHLATRGKPTRYRHEMVAALSSRHRLIRDYLAQNVLRDLDEDLRSFMVETSVLGILSGPLCDQLTGRVGCGALLDELERRQILTVPVDDRGTYRYHEILRQHLEQVLVAEVGETETRVRFRRAGRVLAAAGATPEAVRAYAQAGDWPSVYRLLGGRGEEVAARSTEASDVLGALPRWLVDEDPWLLLADARRLAARGGWALALDRYRQSEKAFGASPAAERCRWERTALATWFESPPTPTQSWIAELRAATRHDPESVRSGTHLVGATRELVRGTAALLSGSLPAARDAMRNGSDEPDASPVMACALRLGSAFAGLLLTRDEDAGAVEFEATIRDAQQLDIAVVARLALAMASASGRERAAQECAAIRRERDEAGDQWSSALCVYFDGIGRLLTNRPDDGCLLDAAARFAQLDAPVLAAWAGAVASASLARDDDDRAPAMADEAVRAARACRCAGASAVALAARDRVGGGVVSARTEALARRLGLAPSRLWDAIQRPRSRPARQDSDVAPSGSSRWIRNGTPRGGRAPGACPPPARVRCFGGLVIELGGREIDLGGVRPRARSTLRMLAVHAEGGLHRERIAEALWPSTPLRESARQVQVAVSALRGLLGSASDSEGGAGVVRDGERYRLVLPAETEIDTVDFVRLVRSAHRVQEHGDHESAIRSLASALDLYTAELLPEEGPADWVVAEREHFRIMAVEASRTCAQLLLAGDRPRDAAQETRRGLALDEFDDALWQLLIESNDRAGDRAVAAVARRQYEDVLGRLGVAPV